MLRLGVSFNDPGISFLDAQLGKLAKDESILTGWKSRYNGGKRGAIPVSEIVMLHQIGSPTRRMPARPFLALAAVKFAKLLRSESVNARSAKKLGNAALYTIRSAMMAMDKPKLSRYTIKKKKGNTKLLIDTGRMFNTVTFEVMPLGPARAIPQIRKILANMRKSKLTQFVSSGAVRGITDGTYRFGTRDLNVVKGGFKIF